MKNEACGVVRDRGADWPRTMENVGSFILRLSGEKAFKPGRKPVALVLGGSRY